MAYQFDGGFSDDNSVIVFNDKYYPIGKGEIELTGKYKNIKGRLSFKGDKHDASIRVGECWVRFKYDYFSVKGGFQRKVFGIENGFSRERYNTVFPSYMYRHLKKMLLFGQDPLVRFDLKNLLHDPEKSLKTVFMVGMDFDLRFFINSSLEYKWENGSLLGSYLHSFHVNKKYYEHKNSAHGQLGLQYGLKKLGTTVELFVGKDPVLTDIQHNNEIDKSIFYLGLKNFIHYRLLKKYKSIDETKFFIGGSWVVHDASEIKRGIGEFTGGVTVYFTKKRKVQWTSSFSYLLSHRVGGVVWGSPGFNGVTVIRMDW